MTPKIIELKSAPLVLVELPEGAKEVHLDIRTGRICWSTLIEGTRGGRIWHYLSSDYMGANTIGILSDLTEDKFSECVDSWESVWNDGSKVYENYKDPVPKKRTAKKSFYSLLESENVYTENPYQKPTLSPITSEDSDDFLFPTESGTEKWAEYENQFLTWKQDQSRTIDPTRTVVLIRKED